MTGATEAAREQGHLVVMGETEGVVEVEDLLIDDMLGRRVEGILYATLSARAVVAPPALSGQRAVLLNCVDLEAGLPSVLPDDAMGGAIAAHAMVESGVHDGIFVVGETPSRPVAAGAARLVGIQEGLSALGVTLAGQVECTWAVVEAFEATSAWLSAGARPQGLICLNDRIAMGVYQALAQHHLRVPYDVAVVSFDGSELSSWLRPRLTSVALPLAEMGRLAMQILLDRDYAGPKQVQLPTRLVPGDSLPR